MPRPPTTLSRLVGAILGLLVFASSAAGYETSAKLNDDQPDGSGLKRLTNYPAPRAVFSGSFSPDGKRITFSRGPGYPGIFVMRADGAVARQVTRGGYHVAPDWGPAR
jgi:Tol biopolymer transport system component